MEGHQGQQGQQGQRGQQAWPTHERTHTFTESLWQPFIYDQTDSLKKSNPPNYQITDSLGFQVKPVNHSDALKSNTADRMDQNRRLEFQFFRTFMPSAWSLWTAAC